MLAALVAILAGLILLADLFQGKTQQVIGNLRPYEAVIGVAAVVLGILNIFTLFGIALILAGLILGVSALQAIPRIGDDLARAGRSLSQVRTVIGVVVLVLGVLRLL
jgi:hypothetical protein